MVCGGRFSFLLEERALCARLVSCLGRCGRRRVARISRGGAGTPPTLLCIHTGVSLPPLSCIRCVSFSRSIAFPIEILPHPMLPLLSFSLRASPLSLTRFMLHPYLLGGFAYLQPPACDVSHTMSVSFCTRDSVSSVARSHLAEDVL